MLKKILLISFIGEHALYDSLDDKLLILKKVNSGGVQ